MGGFCLCTTQSGNLYFRKDQQQVLRNQIDNSGTFNVEKHRELQPCAPAARWDNKVQPFLLEILAYDGVMDGKAVIRECIGVLSQPSVRDIPLSFTIWCFDFSMIYGTTSTHRSKILLVEGRNIYEDEEAEG